MERKKFEVILDRLLEKSMGGSLRWKSTSDPESFLLVLKDSSISVSHELGFDGEVDREEEYVNFDFRNKDGEIVQTESVARIGKKADPMFEKAVRIYSSARNEALRIDETVDRIIEQLAA